MYNREYTPKRITELKPNEIFVFGSNLYEGLQGQKYAIPSMDGDVEAIKPHVEKFIEYAIAHPEYKFLVAHINSETEGLSPCDIAPMFLKVIDLPNVILPQKYVQVISRYPEVAEGAFHVWDSKRDYLDEYHSLTERMIRGDYDAYNKLKRLRRSVFQHTMAVVNHGWYTSENKKRFVFPDDADMVRNTVRYDNEIGVSEMPQNTDPTIIEVENDDSLYVGTKLKEQGYNPAVLNMAFEHVPCYDESAGDGANEEALLRTNLFRSLSQFSYNDLGLSRFENHDFINELLYTPNAICFRGSEQKGYALLDNPICLSFISVAGVFNDHPCDSTIPDNLVEAFTKKIRAIFRIGLLHGHDSLVLGALGCGAFHNPPRHVARLFHEVMNEPEFKDRYRRIVFAILENHHVHQSHNPEGNYKPFVNEFTRFEVESDFKKWIEVNEIHSRTLESYKKLLIIQKDDVRLQNRLHGLVPKIEKTYKEMSLLREDLRDLYSHYGGYYVMINQRLDLIDKMGQPTGHYDLELNHTGIACDDWLICHIRKDDVKKSDCNDEDVSERIPSDDNGTGYTDTKIYEIDMDGNAVIYDGVTEIPNELFKDHPFLSTVSIPESVTEIGDGAFTGCTKLSNIVLPKGLKHIGDYAFKDCKSLKDINIPNGVKKIGKSAFFGCDSLNNVTIPDSVEKIGCAAFVECDSLTSFDFTKPSIGNRVNAVDLGLPSGTEWADCNVGADKPEEYGGYYAWGETNEKKVYDMENCLLGDCDDQYSISVILDDAASIKIKFGWKWQMPTRDQIAELVTYCTYDWVTINGTKGGRFTGPNGIVSSFQQLAVVLNLSSTTLVNMVFIGLGTDPISSLTWMMPIFSNLSVTTAS